MRLLNSFLVFALLHVGASTCLAQLQFGIKGGMNFNSFEDIKAVGSGNNTTNLSDANSKIGFHVGVYSQIKLPVVGLFVRPELVYTSLKAEYELEEKAELDLQKIDVPVLIGYKFLGVSQLYIGPAFQFILDSDFDYSNAGTISTTEFSLGLQIGGGVTLGKFGIDLRWERGLSKLETIVVNALDSSEKLEIDSRPNQVILGVSYRL